jgi:hypothetical protein
MRLRPLAVALSLALALGLTGASACSSERSADPGSTRAGERGAPGPDDDDAARKRDELLASARARLAALDDRIDAIKADLAEGGGELAADSRGGLETLLEKLESQRGRASAALDAAGASTRERWKELERDGAEALADVELATNDLITKLKAAGVKVRARASEGLR